MRLHVSIHGNIAVLDLFNFWTETYWCDEETNPKDIRVNDTASWTRFRAVTADSYNLSDRSWLISKRHYKLICEFMNNKFCWEAINDVLKSIFLQQGIIDYIRTFTWDKKLEMIIKSTGILGGRGKTPTIIYPKFYQKRFIEALIDTYFIQVNWLHLSHGVLLGKNNLCSPLNNSH